mgnify:CR=1 FL=1
MLITALLRGVTPNGKNRIPKMSYLAGILKNTGFNEVRTYIQSGNIILNTELSYPQTAVLIRKVILEKIGADLPVIIKTKEQLSSAIKETPFGKTFDHSRIHLVFTNSIIDKNKLAEAERTAYEGEIFAAGKECMYLYLPRDAKKKKLNTNYLEKKLKITATMRKLNVIEHLYRMM